MLVAAVVVSATLERARFRGRNPRHLQDQEQHQERNAPQVGAVGQPDGQHRVDEPVEPLEEVVRVTGVAPEPAAASDALVGGILAPFPELPSNMNRSTFPFRAPPSRSM